MDSFRAAFLPRKLPDPNPDLIGKVANSIKPRGPESRTVAVLHKQLEEMKSKLPDKDKACTAERDYTLSEVSSQTIQRAKAQPRSEGQDQATVMGVSATEVCICIRRCYFE
jgi:hypothetical protein